MNCTLCAVDFHRGKAVYPDERQLMRWNVVFTAHLNFEDQLVFLFWICIKQICIIIFPMIFEKYQDWIHRELTQIFHFHFANWVFHVLFWQNEPGISDSAFTQGSAYSLGKAILVYCGIFLVLLTLNTALQ